MFQFSPSATPSFRCHVSFRHTPYANMSFFDAAGEKILFHLSLRRTERLAVCNHRDAQAWGRERHKPIILRDSAVVEIRFGGRQLEVLVDDVTLFRFGGRFKPSPYKGLERISQVDFQGNIYPEMHGIHSEDLDLSEGGAPVLSARLQVQSRVATADTSPQLHSDTGIVLPAILHPDGSDYIAQAILPGWIWKDIPPEASLTLHFAGSDGQTSPTLTLHRHDIAQHITQTLEQIDPRNDSFGAMQVLEHVRFANLMPHLSQAQRQKILEAAAFYGLSDFLLPQEVSQDTHPTSDPVLHSQDVPEDPLAILMARFHQTLLRAPESDPVQVAADLLPSDPQQRVNFFVMLSDVFCREGTDFPAFYALDTTGVTKGVTPGDDVWYNTAILPFLIMQNRLDEVRDVLWAAAPAGPGWIVTPAIAWVGRWLCSASARRNIPQEAQLEELVYAFKGVLDARADVYFDRAHCQELMRAWITLIQARHRFADYLHEEICHAALKGYGLSPAFWRYLEATKAVPPMLLPMKEAFAQIEAWCETTSGSVSGPPPAAVVSALNLLADHNVTGLMQFRREIWGPDNPDTTPNSALRCLAHPNAETASPFQTATAQNAVRDAYEDVPRAPYLQLQADVCHRIRGLHHAQENPEFGDSLDTLLDDIVTLIDARSLFIGLPMLLALVTDMPSTRDVAVQGQAGDRVLTTLATILDGLPDDMRQNLAVAPALISALPALKADAHAPAQKALELLNSHLPLATEAESSLPDRPALPAAAALFDTVVVVFSCKPNLTTRIPEMRAGWLRDLDRLGVPYVIVVGDGDGRLDGDIVHLDAPDTYEGLPSKTLAAVRWVHDNTSFAHMLKIDDDCFLNAEAFFDSLSYRKFDYYGRRLTRTHGQMDRAWHCAKSSSQRGQFELDKSPEPSSYADGGCGWTLSRRAMAELLEAVTLPTGQMLIQTSFMEDKLLGDLLALRGIEVASEDYCVSIRRRSHSMALPVALWVNGFDASEISKTKMTHLDGHKDQARARERLQQPVLRPAKIWPSYQDAKLGYQSNALELVSSEARLERAQQAEVAVVACLRNEMFMLPHFLEHYRKLGAGAFLIADNFSDDGTLEYLAKQDDVALFSVDTDYNLSHYGVAWQQALLAEFRRGKWTVVADADEFLIWQENQTQTLPELVSSDAFKDKDAARIFMVDMYPKDRLQSADFKTASPFAQAGYCDREPFLTNWPGRGPYSNMPVWTSALRHRLIPGSRPDLFVAQKIALLRYQPWMRLSAGLHFLSDIRLTDCELLFAHFKYNADFRRKAEVEVARQQHFNNAEEYRKYLAIASEGRDIIYEDGLSVPWQDSPFVQKILT